MMEEMQRVELFRGLGEEELGRIAPSVERRRLDAGELLLEEGQGNRRLFAVVSGRLKVWRRSEVEELVLAEVGEGELLGEMSVLEAGPVSANVTALEPTVVLSLEGRVLEGLVDTDPGVAAHLYRRLALLLKRRLEGANRLVAAYHGLQATLLEIERLRGGMEPPL